MKDENTRPPPDIRELTITLIGRSPLIVNNWPQKRDYFRRIGQGGWCGTCGAGSRFHLGL